MAATAPVRTPGPASTAGPEDHPDAPAGGRLRLVGRVLRGTRLSWLGATMLVMSAVAWTAGWLLGWIELMTMAAAGLVLMVLAIPFTFGAAAVGSRLELSSARVVVGDRAAGRLVIRNESARRQLALELDLPVGGGSVRFAVPSLAGGAEHEELIVIPTERRGVIPIGPATAVRGDPLGLLRRGSQSGTRHLLYVHPRTVRTGQLGHGQVRDLEGSETDTVASSDVAFHALREYVPGDDRRHIHWRSTARTNHMMVRQFADTRRSHITVLLSAEPSEYADEDEYETAVSVVASIAVQAIRDQQSVRVMTAGEQLPAITGAGLLDELSGVDRRPQGGLQANARLLAPGGPPVGALVLVSGSGLEPARLLGEAKRLGAAGTVLCLRVDLNAQSGIRFVGGVPVLTLGRLEDLRRLLRAAE